MLYPAELWALNAIHREYYRSRLPQIRLRVVVEGTVREVQYDDEFTTIVATIPTRVLEDLPRFLRCQ